MQVPRRGRQGGSVSRASVVDSCRAAVDTRLSGSHRDTYTVTATLGDNGGGQAATTDVDFYRVYLEVGDRLLADISTSGANAPETSLQIFDASGSVQLAATTTVGDPSLDFVATTSGIYFVGVSSRGNESYSGRTLANRQEGFGGVGTYQLSLQSFAPRSFVVSFENPAPNGVGDADIDQAAIQALVGTTFTVTTVEDIPAILPQGSGTKPSVAGSARARARFPHLSTRVVPFYARAPQQKHSCATRRHA